MRIRAAASLLLLGGAWSCSHAAEGDRAIASPSLSISQAQVTAGRAVDVTYRFEVAPDAPPVTEDQAVFVHAHDARGTLVWTGDHQPRTPTRQWAPGSIVEYVRPLSVPWDVSAGHFSIVLGLYSPRTGERLRLSGTERERRSYLVASLDVIAHEDPPAIFVDGWYGGEGNRDVPGQAWHWSAGAGTIWLKNPKRDAVFVLEADQPMLAWGAPHRVAVRIGAREAATFSLSPGEREIQRVLIPASQLGDAPLVSVVVATDRTFVPALVPSAGSGDTRELGVRVFSAYFESEPRR